MTRRKANQNLTDQQWAAIPLLVQGKTPHETASEIGVSHTTVSKWKHSDDLFIKMLMVEQFDRYKAMLNKVRDAQTKAIDKLVSALDNSEPDVQIRAATLLLKMPTAKPRSGADYYDMKAEQFEDYQTFAPDVGGQKS